MRWALVWLGCAFVLALAACDGNATPPASTPEPRLPVSATAAPTAAELDTVATAAPAPASTPIKTPESAPTSASAPSPTPTPVPTQSPTAEPTPVPTQSPTAEPTPVPTQSPTPEPTPVSTPTPSPTPDLTPTATPEPHGIEFTPLRLGEPRPQPSGYAIYYGVHNCEGVWDVYRVVAGHDDAEPRPTARVDQGRDVVAELATNLAGDGLPVQNVGAHSAADLTSCRARRSRLGERRPEANG